ncbi:transposase [Solihabitans fulvus]|uniref:transposase n=1 Tax=Solihabitans fulvus TaxID=1892852 RepID=UPI001CB7659C|nr:transposase [Solihabitans fulvus]
MACLRLRPTDNTADPEQATKTALRALARRHRSLSEEIADLDTHPRTLVTLACPQLVARHGFGIETTAQILTTLGDNPDRVRTPAALAALFGTAPMPASSGRTDRHRLSRSGDRQANRALHMIACTRLASCPRTQAYAARRTQQGLSKKDILRCLKNYIAREIHKTLTRPNTTPQTPLDKP